MGNRGRWVVLEGIDGSGTTTQAAALAAKLESRGLPVHRTQEPSGGDLGRALRTRLRGEPPSSRRTLALLFAADRLDHVDREIEPALMRGEIVVCDRYLVSSWVYQSLDCDPGWIRELNRWAPWPDLTVLLDVDPDEAMRRTRRRGSPEEIFETLDLQRRVAQGYRDVVGEDHQRLVSVDGERDVEEITEGLLALGSQHGLW